MKYGLHNELASDFEDIGDRILKWGYERINYALKLNRTFLRIPILLFLVTAPLSQPSVKHLRQKHQSRPDRTRAPKSASTTVTHEVCYVCGRRHPSGCVLQSHRDANNNSNILLSWFLLMRFCSLHSLWAPKTSYSAHYGAQLNVIEITTPWGDIPTPCAHDGASGTGSPSEGVDTTKEPLEPQNLLRKVFNTHRFKDVCIFTWSNFWFNF
jgi:hypothetical protein